MVLGDTAATSAGALNSHPYTPPLLHTKLSHSNTMADPNGHMEDRELRIRQLERSLAALTKERDDLAEDVAQLCVSRYSSTIA